MADSLTMADSIRPPDLIAGYDAYATYVDGDFKTDAAVRARFPGSHILSLTVLGGSAVADGVDCEQFDVSAPGSVAWALQRLSAGAFRPCIYASIGDRMPSVVQELNAAGIALDRVRLWSAHYGQGEHICGPSTCPEGKRLGVPMDGTQWTDKATGYNHALIDASILLGDFFGPGGTTTSWAEFDMAKMKVLRMGDRDVPGGGFFWVVRLQDDLIRTGRLQGIPEAAGLVPDGVFGTLTDQAVRKVQEAYRIAVDGIVGPDTRSVLLTGAV